MAELERHQVLIAAYLAGAAADAAPAGLGNALVAAYDHGRATWPTLVLAEDAFARFLAERVAADEVVSAAPPPAADLYLACACSVGLPGASELLIETCGGAVRAALARVLQPAEQAEAAQRVWENLLVAGARPGRIAQYRGRGPLSAFVRVAAVRMAITELRKRRPVDAEEIDDLRLADGADDPELQYLKQVYRAEFRHSFARAFSALSAPQQLLLRLDVVDQLTIDQAAAVYGRSRTTTGRHLLEARQDLARHTLTDLQNRLALPPSELQSVARLVRSQIDLSVERLLVEP